MNQRRRPEPFVCPLLRWFGWCPLCVPPPMKRAPQLRGHAAPNKGDVERVYAWACKKCQGTCAFIAREGSDEVPERYLGCPACGACAMARGVESGR